MPRRLALCDDAVAYPALVRTWVAADEDLELVAITRNETELLEALPAARPDTVLLDFMLPEGPGTPERLARVRELAPGVRVVLTSSLPAMLLQDEAERLGADAWCPKAAPSGDLLAALADRPIAG